MRETFSSTGPGLVAFDMIGTMVDAGHRYATAFANVCAAHGIERPDEGVILKMLGEKNLKEIIDEFIPAEIARKLNMMNFMNECNQGCDLLLRAEGWEEHLFDGLPELLSYMRAYGYEPAIYTGIRKAAMERLVSHHELDMLIRPELMAAKDPILDANVTQHDLKAMQLARLFAAYEDVYDEEGLEAGHAFHVVGDSPADAKAAEALGATFYGFAPTPEKRQSMLAAGVHEGHIFTSFTQLAGIFGIRIDEPAVPAMRKGYP